MLKLADALSSIFAPLDRRPTVEYAAEHVELSSPITKPGKFDCSSSRHFLEIFGALDDERTREVNVLKPVRGGGSLVGDVHLVTSLARRPMPSMCVFQTDPDAKIHFFDRIEKNLMNCAATAALLPARYEWSEIFLKSGHTLYTGGPGISNLQSKGVCNLWLDEPWIYPLGRMADAEARVGDFLKLELSKILRTSQGGTCENRELKDCDWVRAWSLGEQNEWEVACQHCGKYFDPIFSGARDDGTYWGITWDHHRLPNGDWDLAKCVPTVRFECPHCGNPSLDTKKVKDDWNRTGRYRLNTEKSIVRRGFHWESVIDFPWSELAHLWLVACNCFARGDLKPKIQFFQKRRAINTDEESLLRGGLTLKRVAYEINSDWPDEKDRYLVADRQEEDLLWWSVRAWSNDKSRKLGFGKCYGFAALEEIRIKFKVQPNLTGVDSAFMPKGDHGVYAACIKYGWIAIKGAKDQHFVHSLKNKRRVLKSYAPVTYGDPSGNTARSRFCPLIRFSKPQMNAKVQELIDHGHWEEPLNSADPEMEKEYNAQMAARVKKTEYVGKTGETNVYWKETKNDHARDLANGQVLFAVLKERLPDPASERLAPSEQAEAEEKK
jgi:hypothetical protein